MDQEAPGDLVDHDWEKKDITQRQALRNFWDAFRREDQRRLKSAGISRIDMVDDLKLISADKDPEFLAAVLAERYEIISANKPDTTASRKEKGSRQLSSAGTKISRQSGHIQGVIEPVQAPPTSRQQKSKFNAHLDGDARTQTEWGATPVAMKPYGTVKDKPKTRGDASAVEELGALNLSDEESGPQTSDRVQVKKSAFDIFRSLFARGGYLKSVGWDKFVDAMAKVGFMSRRSGGSAVTFEPNDESKWYGQGSIVLHRPHPDSTIDSVMLSTFGKRMKKWFRWSKETFELAK